MIMETFLVFVGAPDEFGAWTRKEKNSGGKSLQGIRQYIRPDPSRIICRIVKGRGGIFVLVTVLNPARNSASNPAKSWSDSDVASVLFFVFVDRLIEVLLYHMVWCSCFQFSSPDKSWAGSSLTLRVRPRGRWGCHSWYQGRFAWSLRGVSLGPSAVIVPIMWISVKH